MPTSAGSPLPTFGGRFQASAESGFGGMATIYRALDLDTGQEVALKLLHERDPVSRERFAQEAALLAELAHPAIVRYVAHGTTGTGELFLAMEWLEGETLEARLLRGPLDVLEAARLGRHVLDALSMAHRQGIIHRDIKPSNLFLQGHDLASVKLLDFGIARRMFEARRMTQMGAALGTPMYMSPEQAHGDREIDARADLFSLGCVLFECLTGTPPFIGETSAAVLAKICLADSPTLHDRCPGLPQGLDQIVQAMLAKDRDQRPSSAAELAERLAVLIDQLAAAAAEGGAASRAAPAPLRIVGEQRVVSVMMISRPRVRREEQQPVGRGQAEMIRTWQDRGAAGGQSTDVFDEAQFGQIRATVDKFGGRLDRFLDGTVVVTMIGRGAPTDQAAQAARCALSLRDLLPGAAMAVSTGRAIVGGDVPLGNVLDGAATLLGGSPEGAICIDQVTADLVEARFELRAGQPRQILFEKGLKEAPRTLLGKEMPCVGRERELGALIGIFEECATEPGARAVLVTSPPGGGKSRVRHELVERLQSRGEPFEFLIAQGDPLRQGSPFALVGAALRGAAGISGTESPLVQQKRLAAFVGRHVQPDRTVAVACFLGEICGIHFPDAESPALAAARKDPRLMADRTLGAWLDWIQAVTVARPLLLVLEDLHWGDLPSVQLVDAALRAHRERPFMVAGFARPEVDERFASLWADRDVQRVALPPLTMRACGRLVRAALADLDDDRIAWLIERSDGNPFVLEELLRATALGAQPQAGVGVVLPDSVIGMVQARFDILGPEAKRILRAASIYGQTFRRSAVAALLGEEESAGLGSWLEVLAAREVIFPRSAGQTQEYVFRHALLRDAAYDLLPSEARKIGHRVAGDWLEQNGEHDAIVLVEHFERGGDLLKAAHFCRAAAAQALEAMNPAAAIERSERGARCGASGETLGHLCFTEAQARFWRAEYVEGERAARRALELLSGPARLLAAGELVSALGQQAKFAEIQELLEECAPGPLSDAPLELLGCVLRAADFMMLAALYGVAEDALVRVEARRDDLPPALMAQLHNQRAKLSCHSGDHAAGVAGFQRALALFEALDDQRNACELLTNVGATLGELGVLDQAEEALRRALVTAERLGIDYVVQAAVTNLVLISVQLGKAAEARRFGERSLALTRQQSDPRIEGFAELYLSLALHAEGRLDDAEAHARRAVALLGSVTSALPFALATLARIELAQGRADMALANAREAHRFLEEAGHVEDGEASIRLVLAESWLATGNPAEAAAVIAEARARLQERALSISRQEWRDSFLALPDHERTLTLL